MGYRLTASVERAPGMSILKEEQVVSDREEAYKEQRRWLQWWEDEGEKENAKHGWHSVTITIMKQLGD